MPSDSVRKLASLVDSSETGCKKDEFNTDGPAQADPRELSDEEACRSGAEEEQVHSCNRVGMSSELEKNVPNDTRYFIIKSLNHQNIQLSVNKGIWATQVMNEPILDEAFQKTLHLKNPWNDYKPVKISRDCQELPRDLGESLCELLDGGDGNLERDGGNIPTGVSHVEPFIQNADFNVNPIHMVPPYYSYLPYQHQAVASPFDWPNQRSQNRTSICHGTTKPREVNSRCANRMDNSSQLDRRMSRPSLGTFTEDDILEMTYEEYLEAHDARGRILPVAGRSMSLQKLSSRERSDESQSVSSSKKRSYHQLLE